MKNTKKVFKKTYSTDALMKNLWLHLARDFRAINGQGFCEREENLMLAGIKEFRAHTWPAWSQAPVYLQKQLGQLANLFKRCRFRDDAYTDEELERRTFEKFMQHQLQMRDTNEQVPQSTYLVVQRARQIAKEILGEYSLPEHVDACRFGIKANLGVPASRAYLDVKLSEVPGSEEHYAWFHKHVEEGDSLLQEVLAPYPNREDYRFPASDLSLVMVNVDKSWKIRRGIIPDTVVGSFYSNGLGTVIAERLRAHGLNIRVLQRKHRRIVKTISKTRSHVTADLSNASNSFTWSLMCRLLPRKWLSVLNFGRSRMYTYSNKDYKNVSFMMMGIGFTFPVETLLFYCLIRAIGDLLGRSRSDLVSVYGDDLIYPTFYHPYVLKVFADLGFTMNGDKTFVKDYFRESCGADFCRGTDVRPYQPEVASEVLYREPYVLLLYKTLNGLLTRWDQADIPQTVRFLLLEILRCKAHICLVPNSFPDFSGLHITKVTLENYWPVHRPRLNPETWLWDIWRYEMRARKRIIWVEKPYYWSSLRTATLRSKLDVEPRSGVRVLPTSSLVTVVADKAEQPRNYRSKLTGKRLKLRRLAEAEKLTVGTIIYHCSSEEAFACV